MYEPLSECNINNDDWAQFLCPSVLLILKSNFRGAFEVYILTAF